MPIPVFDLGHSQASAKHEDALNAKREDAAGAALCIQTLQSSLLVRRTSAVELV